VSSARTTIEGWGLQRARASDRTSFIIVPRDTAGKALSARDALHALRVTATLVADIGDANGVPVAVELEASADDACVIASYICERAGALRIEVTAGGEHVQSSPVQVEVVSEWLVSDWGQRRRHFGDSTCKFDDSW
jgi:hypothetical protein